MKKWAALTVLIYAAALTAFAVPLLLACFGDWRLPKDAPLKLDEAVQVYRGFGFWIWLVILALGEICLLAAPVQTLQPISQFKSRRPMRTLVVTASFFMANLALAAFVSCLCAVRADHAWDIFAIVGGAWHEPEKAGAASFVSGMVIVMLIVWVFWALIFYRSTKKEDSAGCIRRAVNWLLRGSVLELLVAVPSHVIVRRRQDCCAPVGTFWGIATGISVMLLSFGPGVFFLFAERLRRLKPKRKREEAFIPEAPKDR
jgi:hypothetical protein